MLKVSDIIEIEIEKIVFGGEGLGYYNELAIFVPMSVPKDKLRVKIISVKKTYARALINEIISPSPERKNNGKISFEEFDGCDFAMLNYQSQLKYKKIMLEDVLERIGGLRDFKVPDLIGATEEFNYRNKIIEPFSYLNGKIITGFFSRKSHDVFEVEENILNSKLGNRIIKKLKEILNREKISVYDEKKHNGILRNIMVRTNSKDEAMVVLIVNLSKVSDKIKNILLELKENMKEIKSLYLSLNTKKTNTVIGEKNIFIAGERFIQENIEGINFNISPTSFFQINLEQTKKLYSAALSFFSDTKDKYIVDAYSGTGTIGMIMSKKAKKVYAIEMVKSATLDGIKTADENGIKNIEFINGTVEEKLVELIKSKKKIDTIIFDPPRKGLENSIIEKVAELDLKEVVYVSCNPATLARDIKLFAEKGYFVERFQAVDMFPQTSHVETVALLSKLDVDKHISVKIELDELDLTSAESKATYEQIKEYILNKFGLKVSALYIAQIKKKCGIELRENYNKSKKEKQVIPQCTPEKEEAIMDALRYFKMI